MRCYLTNMIWKASLLSGWRRFRDALSNPQAIQREKLLDHLRVNASTQFGKKYRFDSIKTVKEYQERVPISSYEDYQPCIDQILRGETDVLTKDRIIRFVPSSGSTSARKLIPYNRTLQREFQAGIAPWIVDLYQGNPDLMRGRAYWSISPNIDTPDETDSAVPIGFDKDSAYLGNLLDKLIAPTFAVPSTVAKLTDPHEFRMATLTYLLGTADLRLISVWHPSFLTLLLDALEENWEKLRQTQANRLKNADPRNLKSIWPNLGFVSCWGDGQAMTGLDLLKKRVGDVPVQPKGLIATEAFISLPFQGQHPLSIASHFFEFLDVNDDECLVEDLQEGQEYRVLITTGAGLYRYQMHDCIRVTGFIGQTPSITFIGKTDQVSDRFGEKLNDWFVADVLEKVLKSFDFSERFAMLAPEDNRYVLYLESEQPIPLTLAEHLDQALCENPHYQHCINLGQLVPAQVIEVNKNAHHRYLEYLQSNGQRLGDIKPAALSKDSGWQDVLARETSFITSFSAN